MSEFNRNNKDFKKRTDFYSQKDHRKGSHGFKYDRDNFNRKNYEKPVPTQQPTILLKSRDVDQGTTSTSSITQNSRKEADPIVGGNIIVKSFSSDNSIPAEMTTPIKFLQFDSSQPLDTCLEYLSDGLDFLVIGCIGSQGVGKSLIMSLLADPTFNLDTGSPLFPIESKNTISSASHETEGIDLYISNNRTIFLDCQPILSPSLIDSDDSYMKLSSLELAAFLFSICHVVIFMQDSFYDPDLIRFLQTSEMLKPSTTITNGETVDEYFSHLVFLHNKIDDWEFQSNKIKQMQEFYLNTFEHSRLKIQSGFGIANGDASPALNTNSCGKLINLFLLPQITEDNETFTGHPSFKALFRHFRNQILSTPRTPISHTPLTEKNWFHYATKVWDGIQKSTFFNEYHRLLMSSQ